MSTPRSATVSIDADDGEWVHITPLSDLHIESDAFDNDGFQAFMRERCKLPNHRVILLGDVMDLVVPRDLKRWRPSVQDPKISGRDDWVNAAIEVAVERLAIPGAEYDLVIPGNHEDEFVKRHGVDVTSILAHRLKCQRGGYSGYMHYRLCSKMMTKSGPKGEKRPRTRIFTMAYHHGAWGGRVIKGFGGARDWFRGFDGWHMALYGHNHQVLIHRENRVRPGRGGAVVHYPVYYVATGSWVESYSEDGKKTHYAERAGHMPTTQYTPLIKVRQRNLGGRGGGWQIEYNAEA